MNLQQPIKTRSSHAPWQASPRQATIEREPLPVTGGVLGQIGNTPLLDLSAFARGLGVSGRVGVYAKAEWLNPGGSVKARAALRIVEEAERTGQLAPDKILIDSSSGNTGIAFALIALAALAVLT